MVTEKSKKKNSKLKGPGEKKNRVLLVTKMGGGNYGVWRDDFKSMEEGRQIFSLPLTPPHFAGISDIKGRTVSLFDLAVLLGLPPMHSYEKNCLFVMSNRKSPIAFATEGVFRKLDVPSGDVMAMPGCLQSHAIDSCVLSGDELIPVINLSHLGKELSGDSWELSGPRMKIPDDSGREGPGKTLRLFAIGGETFAAAGIDARKGLMKVDAVCPLPLMPDFVRGITLLNGVLVTVIDTPSMLGVKDGSDEVKVLLSEIGGDSFGFIVDSDEGPAGRKTKTLPFPPIAEREWMEEALLESGNLIPLIRLPELIFLQHYGFDREELEKSYVTEELVETGFGNTTIDVFQFRIAGHSHALPALEVKDVLPYSPCRRLPHLPSILHGLVEHNGKVLPVLDIGACFGMNSCATEGWKMLLVEKGDFSALVLTESAPEEKSLSPEICWTVPMVMKHRFIYGCYPDNENREIRLLLNLFELALFYDE